MSVEELRKLAEAATPGPWIGDVSYYGGTGGYLITPDAWSDEEGIVGDPLGTIERAEDRVYIAAVSPDRVLTLLDALAASQRREERARELLRRVADDDTLTLPWARAAARAFLAASEEGERG